MPVTQVQPRKNPRQTRAQGTVETLLKATAQLLEQDGYANLTTNHIAERAGVSIGSLYQYFPNKEALCLAVTERHFQRHTRLYIEHLEQVADKPVEVQVRELVRLSCRIAREDPNVAKNLYAELSHIGGGDPMLRMRETISRGLQARFEALPKSLRPADPEMVAFIVTVACSALIGDAVLRKPEWLDDERFLDQVSELILGYYQRLGWRQQDPGRIKIKARGD